MKRYEKIASQMKSIEGLDRFANVMGDFQNLPKEAKHNIARIFDCPPLSGSGTCITPDEDKCLRCKSAWLNVELDFANSKFDNYSYLMEADLNESIDLF